MRTPQVPAVEEFLNIMKEVSIYTDGSSRGNPGPGGYGTVLISGSHQKQLSGGFRKTTNNRMETLAAIKGLEALKFPCKVQLFSDSKYLVDAMNKNWVIGWKKRGWKKADKKIPKNIDIWKNMLALCKKHDVTFNWVKGHNGHPQNELCDKLATEAADKPNLPIDHGFENGNAPESSPLF